LSENTADEIEALEQASQELCTQAQGRLNNPKHLLLIPCLELHLECADLVQRRVTSLGASHRMLLLCRVVTTAMRLLELQTTYHGPDHCDLARTNLDLAQAIDGVLSKSAKNLLQLDAEGYTSASAWTGLESRCRKEFLRISNLYPRDAKHWISAQNQRKGSAYS